MSRSPFHSSPPLISQCEPSRNSQKRKRAEDDGDHVELDRRPFTIHIRQPDSAAPFANPPRTFTSICLLSRAYLPLSFLDTTHTGSRQCITHAPIGALEKCMQDDQDVQILIAEDTQAGALFAIERVHCRVYALCRLAARIKKEELEKRSAWSLKAEALPSKRRVLQSIEGERPWWARAAVELVSRPEIDDTLPELSMARKTSQNMNTVTDQSQTGIGILPDAQADTQLLEPADTKHMTSPEHLQELARSYLDALYISRTSLAYFVKGPLSRTRAAFTNTTDSTLSTSEMVTFLRETILSSTTMDKKYREGVASIVKEIPKGDLDSPEKQTKPKKKRKWKSKRDKLGFFTDEKEFVERWWNADEADEGLNTTEGLEMAIRRRSTKLRTRETHLQIIFVLEVFALEASIAALPKEPPVAPNTVTESQDAETQAEETQTKGEPKKSKPKKQQDLAALLETLIDRLCIWQSLEGTSPTKKDGNDKTGETTSSNDELRSFCIEIVIPFFMSRIPKYATIVNRKLGGPTAPTPVKPKSKSSRKPGEPAVRHAPEKKPRKPLSRVSTETINNAPTQMPRTLHRSATDTDALAQIKREASTEVSLESIPAKKSRRPQLTARNHANLMQSFSKLGRREVDLDAVSAANEAKLKKRADGEAKLREALSVAMKPNRALAHKEIAEQADLSFARATAKNPRAKAGRSSTKINVAATPKRPRTIQATSAHGRPEVPTERTLFPSSGASMVPASAHMSPPRASGTFAIPQTGRGNRHRHATGNVEETPSRGFAKFMPVGLVHEPGTLPESPVAVRRAPNMLQQTPVKQTRPRSPVIGVEATPLMKRFTASSPDNMIEATPQIARGKEPSEPGTAKAMYASLGWDDNEYNDLP